MGLGAGNRVRLPKCVVLATRGLFPSPLCGCECDLWVDAYDARGAGITPASALRRSRGRIVRVGTLI